MVQNLKDYARRVVVKKAREQAGKAVYSYEGQVSCRFVMVFHHDNDSMPRVWTGKEDVKAITRRALCSNLQRYSVLQENDA
ncbi:unnamed protein product [Coffea canephora]|uniref:Sey1/RHD3-like three-helix bundle domain-containing protein n=1 Tax=Coffea canephora TaxID=49390 RepID=A0A068VAI7_COFCA|nr:unnamed protein product [Coffea canephora]